MLNTRLFDVLDQRGQKQRWLLTELARRGYELSESYLSQIKAGSKAPSQRFMALASEIVGLPQSDLFYDDEPGASPIGAERQTATHGTAKGDSRMEPINVAIVGVGNCASSLVQGVHYYKDADEEAEIPGLMHVNLGGYHIRDINFVAAFDVDKEKVGKDLGTAIFSGQNNTYKFADVPKETGVMVHRGRTLDGLGLYLNQVIEKADPPSADVVKVLKESNAQVLINYLPVGSEEATKWYVEQAMQAGCAIINCMPVFIASDPTGYWPQRLLDAGVPDRRRRYQVAGRRHHRAPRPRAPIHEPRRQNRSHVPAQLRRQHRLPQHAGAHPPHLQENLEDAVRHFPDRLPDDV